MIKIGAPRAGVVGWPVDHSRSPTIHRYWLDELGIPGTYERFAVRPGEFRAFAKRIVENDLIGANVTAPHKEDAWKVCDRRTSVAQALGAVNTLWAQDGLLWGDNTDVAGFLANMDESAPGWADDGKSAVVIGAGGAARAIVHALKSRGFERIAIVNRTRSRGEALAAHSGGAARATPWADLEAALEQADLVVNTTVLGMAGQPPLAIEPALLPNRAIVADIVYVPLRTPLIEAARRRGLRAVEGLGMLLHQAAPSFARWFGETPSVTPALRALIEAEVLATQAEAR